MRLTSLGFRTDLMIAQLQGSEVSDRGDRLAIRTRANPGFWWGNFLLYAAPPAPGDLREWEEQFVTEFPGADHRAFGVDGTGSDVGRYEEFAAAGYTVDASAVMTAAAVHAPPHPNRDATYRRLDLTDRRDRDAAIEVQRSNVTHGDTPSERAYVEARMAAACAMQEADHGSWFGAFSGGRMLSGMGLFSDASGVARFQSVDTVPDARGRGLAGSLVQFVSRYGFDELGATTLVMVADPAYLAIDVYRSVGFAATETQLQLEKAPG